MVMLPGESLNRHFSQSLDVLVHYRTQFGDDTGEGGVVRCDRLGAEFADAVFEATGGHASDCYS